MCPTVNSTGRRPSFFVLSICNYQKDNQIQTMIGKALHISKNGKPLFQRVDSVSYLIKRGGADYVKNRKRYARKKLKGVCKGESPPSPTLKNLSF